MSDPVTPPPPEWPPPTAEAAHRESYLPASRWSYGHIVTALAVGVIIGPFLAVLGIAIVQGSEALDDPPTIFLLTVQAVSSIAVLFVLSRYRATGSWRADYGFVVEPRYTWGIAAGMVLQVAVALLTLPLVRLFEEDTGPQQEIAQVAADLSGAELAAFAVLVALVTPVVEEVIFRGMLLGRLVKSMSSNRALLISSGAFAATHLLDPNAILVVPGLFVIGLVLGFAALRTGNLSLPIFIHVGTNGLAVLLLAYADELEELSETVEAIAGLVF